MALTTSLVHGWVAGDRRFRLYDIDFDSSYALGGEALTPATLGLGSIHSIHFESAAGRIYQYDYTNEKVKVLAFPEADTTLKVTDDDSATTNGTDVYVVVDDVALGTAHLESVTANNADASVTLGDGDTLTIQDNDSAASNGVALEADEDNAESVLQADLSSEGRAKDVYVQTDSGRWFRIRHATSGGVATHFDDDGGTATDRLLFVSPTNADATANLDAEVEPTFDLSNDPSLRVLAIGK